jgi:hypothetical protein
MRIKDAFFFVLPLLEVLFDPLSTTASRPSHVCIYTGAEDVCVCVYEDEGRGE